MKTMKKLTKLTMVLLSFMIIFGSAMMSCSTLRNNQLIEKNTVKSSSTVYIFQKNQDSTVQTSYPQIGYFVDDAENVQNLKKLGHEGIGLKTTNVPGFYLASLLGEQVDIFVKFDEIKEYTRHVIFPNVKLKE